MDALTAPNRGPVSAGEIAALTARLRALSNAGRHADPRERAVFLADRDAVLDRITHNDEPQAPQRRGGEVDMTSRHQGPDVGDADDDGWVSDGYEAAHQAHLNYLADGGDRAADADADADADPVWWETEQGRARVGAWARESADPERAISGQAVPGRVDRPEEIAARIQAIHDQALADQSLAEDTQRARTGGQAADDAATALADDDGARWSR